MAAGACILGCAGTSLDRNEARFFARADPWGFILFARNVETPAQLSRLTAELRAAVGRAAPVLIDQEGGRVARLRPPHWRAWPPPLDQMGATGGDLAALEARYALIGAELRAVGIDVNCAPVVDVAAPETHPFLRNRCYGDRPATVAAAARAVARGLARAGVLPVIKHLPGHGRATADSHHALPRVAAPRAALDAHDFAAIRPLADLPLAMTAHVVYDAVDPHAPATTSPHVIAMIRADLQFDGLLMTDDISMNALAGSAADRTAAALAAGCDAVLHCNGRLAEMAAVAEAAGTLSAEGARRAANALAQRPDTPPPPDIAAWEAAAGGGGG